MTDTPAAAPPKEGGAWTGRLQALQLAVTNVQQARVRPLAEPINASLGYHVAGLQIRHDAGELAATRQLSALLANGGQGAFGPHPVAGGRPRYLSLFVCG